MRITTLLGVLLLAMVVLAAAPTPVEAGIGDYRCTDPGRVYHGNPRLIRKPAVISADSVYARIPEYRKILGEGLTDKDVRYHFLMKKASARFSKAVRAMARANDHDFVAEIGAVQVEKKGAARPTNRTSDVISRLD